MKKQNSSILLLFLLFGYNPDVIVSEKGKFVF